MRGAALVLTLGLSCGLAVAGEPRHESSAESPAIAPRYLLMDVQGRAVSSEDFRGRFQLVAFGFVSCPDVCPTTLLEVSEVLSRLGPRATALQALFITVDPERDTREVLREYAAAFDKRILALTGHPDFIRRAADSFRVRYEKVAEPGAAPGNYTMSHTASLVLLDPAGRFVARFPYGTAADAIAARIVAAMEGGAR